MSHEGIVIGLLVAIVLLTSLAVRLRVAYPIILVIGGLALGFIPGLPRVQLEPDLVFLVFLPPLLYWEAVNAPYREYRRNLRPILLLAVGLVLATIASVAAISHALIGFAWPVAVVLGSVVAPTDEVAVLAIADRLGLPRRAVAILEAESLLNDVSSLVIYGAATAVVTNGTFSAPNAVTELFLAPLGGAAIGVAAGWLIIHVRRVLAPPAAVASTISLLSGFLAYLPAEALHLSGILAVVAMGLFVGRRTARLIGSSTRLQAQEMWEVLTFLINSILFILVGLQLPAILEGLAMPLGELLRDAALVCLSVIVLRIVWIFPAAHVPRALSRKLRTRDPVPPWQHLAVLSWSGLRGAVSLAAALALPITLQSGSPFRERGLVIFLTFAVIVATLLFQGLTLPSLISLLKVHGDAEARREESHARLLIARAALRRLSSLGERDGIPSHLIEDLRHHLQHKIDGYAEAVSASPRTSDADAFERAWRLVLEAERNELIRLRESDVIDNDVMRRIQRDIDLKEVGL